MDKVQLSKYIWESQDIYLQRYQKSASALAALAEVLDKEHPLGGGEQEFLGLYKLSIEMESSAFSQIWQDPNAFAWSVYTYIAVGKLLDLIEAQHANGGQGKDEVIEVKDKLYISLEYFKAFMLGLSYAQNTNIAFDKPFHVKTPFYIPGTRYLIEGPGNISIIGIHDGALILVGKDGNTIELSPNKRDTSGFNLHQLPIVAHKGCHIQINPWVGNVPDMDTEEVKHSLNFPFRATEKDIALVTEALDLVDKYSPESFKEICSWMRCISAQQPTPDGEGGAGSASFTFLPGTVHMKFSPNPVWMAETLIHEGYHNRLFFLDESTYILKSLPGPAINYSPWRRDIRPAHGLFHAVVVFIPVTRFYLDIYMDGILQGNNKDRALSFIILQYYRLQMGVDILEQNAEFTTEGREIFQIIKSDVKRLIEDIDAANLPADCPALTIHGGLQTGTFVPEIGMETGKPLSCIEMLCERIDAYDKYSQTSRWRKLLGKKLPSKAA